MKKPTLAHRAEYAAFRLVTLLLGSVPEAVAIRVGELLGLLAGSMLRIRRTTVDRNLALAFPDATPDWRRRVARNSYRHLGRESIMTLRMSRMTTEDVRCRTRIRGLETVRGALAAGRPVVILTGHLGNWELAGAALAARGIPLSAVAVHQANPLFDGYLNRTRARLGMHVLGRGGSVAPVVRSLREGRAVAFVADQSVRRGAVFVDFFGVPAATSRGPAVLALRTGALVVVGTLVRERGGDGYAADLCPIDASGAGGLEDGVERLTAAYALALQRLVEAFPDQYFWMHDRWKRRLPADRERRGAREPARAEAASGRPRLATEPPPSHARAPSTRLAEEEAQEQPS